MIGSHGLPISILKSFQQSRDRSSFLSTTVPYPTSHPLYQTQLSNMKSEQNILLNIFLPPMAVARKNNSSLQDRQVQVACVLTLLLWIPGKTRLIGDPPYGRLV